MPWKSPGYTLDVNQQSINPVNVYLLKETVGKKYHWRYSGVFIANLELISHLSLVFLLLILTK